MIELKDRVALVTGAGSGIGEAIATALAARGAVVVMADIDAARLTAAHARLIERGARAAAYELNVADLASWRDMAERASHELGRITILVNNAGIAVTGPLWEADPNQWEAAIRVNLMGAFYGCRTVLPPLLASGEPGHIVNIASISAFMANPGTSSYDASKAGILGLSDALRAELAGTVVGITIVCPGMTRSGLLRNSAGVLSSLTGHIVAENDVLGGLLDTGAMDTRFLAERVVAAIGNDEYLVFTHADYKPLISRIFEERLAAFSDSAEPGYVEQAIGAGSAMTQGGAG